MSIDNQSSYYDVGGIETIDILQAKLTPEQFEGYLLGNVIKYSSRAYHKHGSPDRDLDKMAVYLKRLCEFRKAQHPDVEVVTSEAELMLTDAQLHDVDGATD